MSIKKPSTTVPFYKKPEYNLFIKFISFWKIMSCVSIWVERKKYS